MSRIASGAPLVGVVALVAGCWPFGPFAPPMVPGPTSVPRVTPAPSPWETQAVIIVQLSGDDGGPLSAAQLAATESVIRDRLASLGGPGASVRAVPDDRLRIDVGDDAWADAVRDLATSPGIVEFIPIPSEYADSVVEGAPLPVGMPIEPIFGAGGVAEAGIGSDQLGLPAVDIMLTPEAAQAFDDHAAGHVGDRFAIVSDGLVLSAPVLHASHFDGRAQISGNFDVQSVRVLVAILEGGPLPVATRLMTVCPATDDCPGPSAPGSATPGG